MRDSIDGLDNGFSRKKNYRRESSEIRNTSDNRSEPLPQNKYSSLNGNYSSRNQDSPRNTPADLGNDARAASSIVQKDVRSIDVPRDSKSSPAGHVVGALQSMPRSAPQDPHVSKRAESSPNHSPRGPTGPELRPVPTSSKKTSTLSSPKPKSAQEAATEGSSKREPEKSILRKTKEGQQAAKGIVNKTPRRINFASGLVMGKASTKSTHEDVSITTGHVRDILDDKGWVQKQALGERVPCIERRVVGLLHGLITRAIESDKREIESATPLTSDRMRLPYAPSASRQCSRELGTPIPEGKPLRNGLLANFRSVQVVQPPPPGQQPVQQHQIQMQHTHVPQSSHTQGQYGQQQYHHQSHHQSHFR